MNKREIFIEALQKEDRAERSAFLDAACGRDAELRKQVEELLAEHEKDDSFFIDSPPPGVEGTIDNPITEKPGTVIRPYKLLQQIGEGGFGVVYMADQKEPVKRRVALKIIKPGMDTRQVIARFEAERQALAMMDHPNIAKVLDAGTTDSGRPYFVMDLVKGVPITQFCDEKRLTPRQRLELFVPVCQAIQHAHQKGVIHRDIKPTNVMVGEYDDRAVPRIIDFGVAKATEQRLTEKTMFTQFGQILGTIDYMSPEQAKLNELDIDTRSDIYSLGVLLYELLTGVTPFDRKRLRSAAFDELLRIIREEEPPKPSLRLSTSESLRSIADNRQIEPKKLGTLVHGDLDWIVMKALEKDRTRRYDTVGELAADVRRHLRHEPIVAGPPSVIYKLRKFARRNKAAMATVGLVAAALVLGLVVSTWQAIRATNAEVAATSAEGQAIVDRDRAVKAQQVAQQERDRAESAGRAALEARKEANRYLHVARMNLAGQAWEDANLTRVSEMLELCRPQPSEPDMREFAWYYLWRLCQPDSMTMKHGGETLEVWKVAWSPDGNLLASAGYDRTVKLWDAATGRLRATLEHDAAVASAVAFSPDGKTLATGSAAAGGQPPQLKLWSMETHAPIASFHGHAGADHIYSVAFSPDGKTLASSAGDSAVRLWDVETGQPIATFPCDQPNQFAIAFSPDGTLLATGGGHNDRLIPELKLWNTTTRQLQATLDGHTYLVCGVAFSPDGKTLASGGADQAIILWDVGSGEIKATITGHEDTVRDLAFTSDGVTLASAGYDRTVRLWDTATGRELRRLLGHKNQARCVAFSPDNRWLLTGGGDGTVRLWGAAVDETRDTIRGQDALMSEVAFSPDGRQLVSGGKDAVRLWDVETAELRATFSGPEGSCEIVAFSPDGRKVAATGFGGAIRVGTPDPTRSGAPRLLDVSTGREPMPLQAARGCVFSCVRFSPDGATLAAAGRDAEGGTVILWDTETGRQRRTLNGHKALVTRVSFSPDGQALASGGADNTIKLWEPATGQLLNTLEGHTGVIFDVRFSPDGKTLASASLDKTVKLWDVASGEVRITLTGHAGYVCSVAFSPDGKTLASAGYDNKVMLWQVSSGEQLATLAGHDGPIWQLVFSPDGKTLASASNDRTIRLWRAATEEEILLSDRAASIATATDGQQRQIVSDLEKFLAVKGGKGLRLGDVSRAVSTARALEEADNHELAASAYRELAETIAGSQDETLSRMSETWEGIARRLALVGNEIELEGSLADGAPLDWAAYQGKVVLAVFWPTWCNPTELSIVRKNHELYGDRGFDVVVFDIGSDRKSLEDYLEREQIEWPVVSAGKEKPEGLSAIYGVDQTATSILIDGQGRVVSLDARGRQLDKLLEQLLGPPVSPALLKSYAGVYMLKPQFALTVTVEDGKLMVQATGQDKYQVFAESKTKFFYRVVEAQISFVPDQDSKINHLVLHQGGLNQKGVRKN